MIRKLTSGIIAVMVMSLGFTAAAMVPSSTASAAGCESRFLTFPAWYNGLLDESTCEVEFPNTADTADGLSNFIWRIVLNVIEMALQLVAYASAGFIIYGGFRYLTSSGSPDKTTAARKTIMNAVIGLVISFFSVVIVTLIANGIKK